MAVKLPTIYQKKVLYMLRQQKLLARPGVSWRDGKWYARAMAEDNYDYEDGRGEFLGKELL